MEPYRNLSGVSGVYAYQIGSDHIHVRFSTGATYRYSYARAGSYHVEQMKLLAQRGSGLNSYINRYVKYSYD